MAPCNPIIVGWTQIGFKQRLPSCSSSYRAFAVARAATTCSWQGLECRVTLMGIAMVKQIPTLGSSAHSYGEMYGMVWYGMVWYGMVWYVMQCMHIYIYIYVCVCVPLYSWNCTPKKGCNFVARGALGCGQVCYKHGAFAQDLGRNSGHNPKN